MLRLNLQLFASLDEIMEAHADKLQGSNVKESFETLNGKLTELGFDVLINNKQKAEFIPSSRLGEVASQRDQFKTQVGELNAQLQQMKDAAKGNEGLQTQLQGLMDQNQKLLDDLESTKVNTEIMLAASDAVNPKDVLVFINKESISVNKKGEIVGVEAEIARLKQEKPYLFKAAAGSKGGSDGGGGSAGGSEKFSMNALIRGASGRK